MAQLEQADPNRWWQSFVDNMSPVIKRVVAFSRKLPGMYYYLCVCVLQLLFLNDVFRKREIWDAHQHRQDLWCLEEGQ